MDTGSPWALLGFFGACFVAASTGARFRPGLWYAALRKPSWTPPDWLFPIAWAVLYTMIAVAGWLAWRRAGFGPAIGIYAIQLLLNASWSAIFFGLRRIDWGMANVLLLWLAIAANIAAFAPIDARAAWLLAPYLVWVTFAAALNVSIWQRNRVPA